MHHNESVVKSKLGLHYYETPIRSNRVLDSLPQQRSYYLVRLKCGLMKGICISEFLLQNGLGEVEKEWQCRPTLLECLGVEGIEKRA